MDEQLSREGSYETCPPSPPSHLIRRSPVAPPKKLHNSPKNTVFQGRGTPVKLDFTGMPVQIDFTGMPRDDSAKTSMGMGRNSFQLRRKKHLGDAKLNLSASIRPEFFSGGAYGNVDEIPESEDGEENGMSDDFVSLLRSPITPKHMPRQTRANNETLHLMSPPVLFSTPRQSQPLMSPPAPFSTPRQLQPSPVLSSSSSSSLILTPLMIPQTPHFTASSVDYIHLPPKDDLVSLTQCGKRVLTSKPISSSSSATNSDAQDDSYSQSATITTKESNLYIYDTNLAYDPDTNIAYDTNIEATRKLPLSRNLQF